MYQIGNLAQNFIKSLFINFEEIKNLFKIDTFYKNKNI